MTQAEKNNFTSAFNQMNSAQCMIFNNLVLGSLSEMQPSGTTYQGSVSMLADDFNQLNEGDLDELCDECKELLSQGVLNKKVNTRPCEVR